MPIYLIEIEGGAHHEERQQMWNNMAALNVKTGDSTPFTRIGIIRQPGNMAAVRRRVIAGINDVDAIAIRHIGPMKANSDEQHQHWRLTALRVFRIPPTQGEILLFEEMRQQEQSSLAL
ncbi:hypothetical protein [Rhizobium sp.]|uniref:hypothetical protein n=1 Tax=Rhizobium sp. TaxID=391 RepID=UPI0034C6DCE3